jgi:hypothetical protein
MASVNRQNFRVVKPFPGDRRSTRQTVVLNAPPQLAKTIVFFNYYCQAKTVNRNSGLNRGILAACNSGSQEDCAASSQYAGHLLRKMIFLAHCPKSLTSLSRVLMRPRRWYWRNPVRSVRPVCPGRQSGAGNAPRRVVWRRSAGDNPTNFLKASRRD